MQDRPDIDELLDAVQGFLRDGLVPMLDGQPKFHARVAANAIAIVRRELELGQDAAAAEQARLARLLGEEGSVEVLNESLSRKIREGGDDLDAAEVLAHLRQTAMEKLAVANPRYGAES